MLEDDLPPSYSLQYCFYRALSLCTNKGCGKRDAHIVLALGALPETEALITLKTLVLCRRTIGSERHRHLSNILNLLIRVISLIFSVQLTQNIIGKHLWLILNLVDFLGIALAVLCSVHHGRDLPSCSLVPSRERSILQVVSHYPPLSHF